MSDTSTERKKLMKSAGVMGFWTFISRITGLVRDQVQAYYLGTTHAADAFRVGFLIPNMLRRLFGEGAMTAAFIPVFTDFLQKRSREETIRFVNNCLYTLGIVLMFLTLLGILFSQPLVHLMAQGFADVPGKLELAADLSRVMFIYMFFIGFASLLAAILITLDIFAAPAFIPILLNLSIIVTAVLYSRKFEEPAYAFAIGVVIGGLLQFLFLFPFALKKGITFKPVIDLAQKELRTVARRMGPGILAMGVAQVNLLVSTRIASSLEEGSVSSLQFANRLEEFTLGIFVISVAVVILPMLSRHASEQNMDKLKESMIFALRLTMLVIIPASIGLIVLRDPIVRILFMRGSFDTNSVFLTSRALLYYVIGLAAVAGYKIIQPAFFSLKDVWTPAWVAALAVIVNLIGCLALKDILYNGGIALAASISSFFSMLLLLIIFRRRYGRFNFMELFRSIMRITAASIVMGAIIYLITSHLDQLHGFSLKIQIVLLIGLIMLAVGIFFATLKLFGADEPTKLMELFRKRRKKEVNNIDNINKT